MLTALLIFPICAVLWMLINAKLGMVKDQPLMEDEPMLDETVEQIEPPAIGVPCEVAYQKADISTPDRH